MTRRRLVPLVLIVLLLGLIGGAGIREARRDREARATADSSPGAAGSPEGQDDLAPSPRRSPQVAGSRSAEAKLKSLLAVREGEMAFIRMPAALMERLMAGLEESGVTEDIPAGPSPVGVISRTMVQPLFAGTGEGIDGSVDLSGEDFEWNGAGMQVRGTTLREEDSVQLKFKAIEGGAQLECQTSLMPGSVFLIRAADPAAGGLLLVIGQNGPGDFPAGDWGD